MMAKKMGGVSVVFLLACAVVVGVAAFFFFESSAVESSGESNAFVTAFQSDDDENDDGVDGAPPRSMASKRIPEAIDPLSSARGEGAVKIPSSDDDLRNASEKHWMEEMFRARRKAGLVGPERCRDVHFGAVAAGKTRGNHRHRGKMETFAVFGNANGIVRVERELGGAYTDYSFRRNEKVIVSSPKGLGHAITNVEEDESRVVVIVACSDQAHEDEDAGQNDYQIWDDL
jgi:dTDP-4-dehydrorhamnose 3,5-epimerase-like enzyme